MAEKIPEWPSGHPGDLVDYFEIRAISRTFSESVAVPSRNRDGP
jgi:hypothetical protein